MRNHSLVIMANQSGERSRNRGATIRRLIRELGAFRRQLVLVLLLVVVTTLGQAAGPWLISRAIDRHILRHDAPGLGKLMVLLFGVYVVGALANRGQIQRVGAIGQQLLAALRQQLFERLARLPLGYFDTHPVGDLMSRVLNDVDTLNQLFSQGITQLVSSLFSLVGILVAMLLLSPRLALVSFLIIPAMLLTTSFFSHRAREAFRQTRETIGDVTAGLQEEIVGVRQAQAFNRTDANIARFRERNAANRTANVQAVAITSAFSPAIDMLGTIATALVIGYGGYLVFHGQLTVGLLAAFLIYVQQFFRPIQLASQVYTQAQSALAGAERIYTIIDEQPEPDDALAAVTLPPIEGAIDFDHVTFGYNEGQPVLHDVSFQVTPGQTVALVGRTGAGKTTIANLIPRFYDVSDGAVRIDGHDVRSVMRETLRRQIGMVLQEPFLFTGTVAENIRYGKPDASQAEIEAAAQAAAADDFIQLLPQGYDTVIGVGGASLSQGQRQLLAFARAVLADPRILILDEATSNIDTRTEQIIQRALGKLLAGRTSVVIAHRLSTIRDADLILVIESGRIIERGSHDELLRLGGRYAELYQRQFRELPSRPAAVAS